MVELAVQRGYIKTEGGKSRRLSSATKVTAAPISTAGSDKFTLDSIIECILADWTPKDGRSEKRLRALIKEKVGTTQNQFNLMNQTLSAREQAISSLKSQVLKAESK